MRSSGAKRFPLVCCPDCGHGASSHRLATLNGGLDEETWACWTCYKRGVACAATRSEIIRDKPHRYIETMQPFALAYKWVRKCTVCGLHPDDKIHEPEAA
jgi:hypothetical protein